MCTASFDFSSRGKKRLARKKEGGRGAGCLTSIYSCTPNPPYTPHALKTDGNDSLQRRKVVGSLQCAKMTIELLK